MIKLSILTTAIAVAMAMSSPGMAVAQPIPQGVAVSTAVQGGHVNIEAQWNESKSAVGRYQAPDGYQIKSATPVVKSELRSSSSVTVSADRREASLSVQVRGKGEWWNKERGWFQRYFRLLPERR